MKLVLSLITETMLNASVFLVLAMEQQWKAF